MRERVLVPQHGVNQLHDEDDSELVAPPARNQTLQPAEQQLHSGNAGAIIMRAGNVKYEFREEARLFWWDWAEQVNLELPGVATSFLYEETFGQQDRVHCLVHLRELADYQTLVALDRSPSFRERVYGRPRIHESKGGGTWEKLFVPGTINDTLLIPQTAGRRPS